MHYNGLFTLLLTLLQTIVVDGRRQSMHAQSITSAALVSHDRIDDANTSNYDIIFSSHSNSK